MITDDQADLRKLVRLATDMADTSAVIEDNADLNNCLVLNLSSRGFAPASFNDAEAFSAALKGGNEWKVIVLDLGLPGEDGLSLARRMRATPESR